MSFPHEFNVKGTRQTPTIKSTSATLTSLLCFLRRGNNWFSMSLPMWLLQVGFKALPPSSYLTVLYGVIEEVVKQQILQLSISVKRFLDFTQEHTGRTERDSVCWQTVVTERHLHYNVCLLVLLLHTVMKHPKQCTFKNNFPEIAWRLQTAGYIECCI